MTSLLSRLARLVRVFASGRDGVAAVEFACVLPVFLILVLGGNELALASTASRKVAILTRTLTDLTTQYTTMSATDVSSVLNASTQVMTPFPTSPVTIVLSEITVDPDGVPRVTWNRQLNTIALTPGNPVRVPVGFSTPGAVYILATVTYAYTPTFGSSLLEPVILSDQLFMIHRRSNTVDLT